MKNAQAWGFDLVIGMAIFLIGIVSFYFYTINFVNEKDNISILQKNGELIAETLMTAGSPYDWNSNNVIRIGIVDGNRINQTKLESFKNLANSDYNNTKILFRVNNDYYVFFDGDYEDGIGKKPLNANELMKITRVVVHNNSVKTLVIYSWKN